MASPSAVRPAATYTLGDADVGASISVVVSYTDGNGTAESLTSAAVGPVANVNDAPSGAPSITGTATEDQTLTAPTRRRSPMPTASVRSATSGSAMA